MLTAAAASWYEDVLPGSRAMAPLDESSALPVYRAAARFVPMHLPVVDLGCGTGRFAELLNRRRQPAYYGYDFAPAVVAEAQRYVPHLTFEVADLREWEHGPDLPDEVCYVLLEVLEHLDDDLDILTRLAPGQPVVLSLPNFWSESHVRRFLQPRDVFDRYGDLLDFTAWQSVPVTTPGRRIHVFAATTRTDRL
jgi:trans-aconitate methyltransferase